MKIILLRKTGGNAGKNAFFDGMYVHKIEKI